MKKLFFLTAAVLASFSLMAAEPDVTVALADFTQVGNTYTKTWSSSQAVKKKVVYVEVPSVSAEGEISFTGADDKSDRFQYIYGTNGTVKDESRKIVMQKTPVTISFSASDILTASNKYYLRFYTENDYKYTGISYTVIDPTKATVKSISVNGKDISDFTAGQTSYNHVLPYGTTAAPVVAAVTGDGATVDITQATATDGTAIVVCTSKDGTSDTKTYTILFSVATSASTDASLKSIAVDGKNLNAFKADSFYYEYHVAYTSTAIPAVTAEENDESANAVVTAATAITKAVTDEGTTVIVVTAQDGTTKLTYKVAFIRDDAVKKINEVIMSNGYSAYIADGQTVINAYYLSGQAEPTVASYKVNEGTSWAQSGNTVTLTGSDASTVDYTLAIAAVEPVAFTTSAITFDGTETWVKAGYGFQSGVYKFSKTDTDYSREIVGKTHIELFLPACDSLDIIEGGINDRDVRIYINGTEFGNKFSLKKNKALGLKVAQTTPFMLTLASAQTSGDGGIKGIQMYDTSSAIDNTKASEKIMKSFENGQLVIIKNGIKYNATGAIVK